LAESAYYLVASLMQANDRLKNERVDA